VVSASRLPIGSKAETDQLAAGAPYAHRIQGQTGVAWLTRHGCRRPPCSRLGFRSF